MKPSFADGCVAGILVGGKSLRMGRTKATLPLADGRMLVERIASVAREAGAWVKEIVILGRCDQLPESLASLPVLADPVPEAGPLSGLCALLEYAGPRWGLLLACDMPLIEPLLLERLHPSLDPQHDAVAFRRGDQDGWHACCAMYHPRLLPSALEELNRGRRSLHGLLASARVATLEPAQGEQQMLMNLNTPQDYDRLLQGS